MAVVTKLKQIPAYFSSYLIHDGGLAIRPKAMRAVHQRVYSQGLAVSGRPGELGELVASTHFRGLKYQDKSVLPRVCSLPCAASLFRGRRRDRLASLELRDGSYLLDRISVFSITGDWIEGSKLRSLLRCALEDILLKPIRCNGILEGLRACLGLSCDPKRCNIEQSSSRADQLIYTAKRQPSGRWPPGTTDSSTFDEQSVM